MSKGKDKDKVLFVGRFNSSDILSGPEKAAKRIYEEHTKNNSSVFIQYFFNGTKHGIIKKLFGKEIINVKENQTIYTLGLFRIFPLLTRYRTGIVHITIYERFAFVFFLYKLFFGYKIIFNPHGIITLGNRIKKSAFFFSLKDKFFEKVFLKYCDFAVFPSENFANIANGLHSFRKSKIRVIPNGIDECFKFNDKKDINSNELNIILESDKIGFEDSLPFIKEAFKQMKSHIHLNIIGKDKNYFSANEKLKISYYDKMPSEKFSSFLSKNDVIISLIRYDSFSISTAEAMSSGVIPIVNKDTGIAGYITNGLNGFKLNYNDSASLAEYIDMLYCNTALRNKMSENAALIYNELSWDKVYLFYKELYSEL